MKTIKALISFAYVDENGITTYTSGQVYEVSNEIATQMIAVGYAEEYSSGGGGSSDFSTAEVTLINSANVNKCVLIPNVEEADPPLVPNAWVQSMVSMSANETFILNVPLYKGHCVISVGASGDQVTGEPVASSFAVTSGSATSSLLGVDITGDCTITIS